MPGPFFIVGNDRSGTTMLRLILDRGREAAIPPESMFLTDFAEDDGSQLLERVWHHPKVHLWDLAPDPPAPPPGLDDRQARRFAFEAPFVAYAAKHGKPRWGDKTPHYVHHVDHLLAIWPDARFVILVRDGRDVALSLKPLPFGPNNAWAAAQWWARGIRAGERAQQQHPDNVLTVRYEDIAQAPAGHVRRICDFLELTYDDDMLDLQHADRAKIVPDQTSWFPRVLDGISTAGVGRWRREMSPRSRGVFAALAGDELARHGYEVGEAAPPTARQERWFHYQNEFMRNVNFLRLRLVQERGRELRFALARRFSAEPGRPGRIRPSRPRARR